MSTQRILCVDNDEDICNLLTTMLKISDLESVSVMNVESALQMISEERFNLYVIDNWMSDTDGLTQCEQIRAIDKDTPIIIFSGDGYQSQIDEGMLAGANAYLVKPDSSALISTVKNLLNKARRLGFELPSQA